MDATLQSRKEKIPQVEKADVTAVVTGLFSFVVKAAKRIAESTDEDLAVMKDLVTMFPEASDTGKVEIVEAIMEQIFPTDNIGGIAKERRATARGKETTKKCREAIGKRIAKFRSKAGMTQGELAKRAGLPQSHISRLETGLHTPTHLTIQKVAAALEVHPSALDMGYPEDE